MDLTDDRYVLTLLSSLLMLLHGCKIIFGPGSICFLRITQYNIVKNLCMFLDDLEKKFFLFFYQNLPLQKVKSISIFHF